MAKTAIPDASRGSIFHVDPDNLTIIGLDTDDGPGHELYDERILLPLSAENVASVVAYGVVTTVNVRKNGDQLEVIDGRQRVRWARLANSKLRGAGKDPITVPVLIRRIDVKTAAGEMIVQNEHRRDDDALTRAKKAQRMLTAGRKMVEVALAFGVSVQSISQWLKLLDLSATLQKMLEDGRLSATTASTLASLDHKAQAEAAKALIESGQGSVAAKKVVRQTRERKVPAEEGWSVAPSKALIRKVIAHELFAELAPEAQAALFWVSGDRNPRALKGLSAIVAAVTGCSS